MWLQNPREMKLELCPFLNQWWEIALHITPRGLTTGLIPLQPKVLALTLILYLAYSLLKSAMDRPKN